MKNKIILLILVLWFSSCTEKNIKNTPTTFVLEDGRGSLEMVTIDSCQYLFGPWGNATVLTHKGNCNNSIHKNNQK